VTMGSTTEGVGESPYKRRREEPRLNKRFFPQPSSSPASGVRRLCLISISLIHKA
jgi:hypothetical protein